MTRAGVVWIAVGALGLTAGAAGFLVTVGGRPAAGATDAGESEALESRVAGLEKSLETARSEIAELKGQVTDLGTAAASSSGVREQRRTERQKAEKTAAVAPSFSSAAAPADAASPDAQDPVAALLEKLKSPDIRKRFEAVRELDALADKGKALEIAKSLLTDSSSGLRMQAIQEIAKLDPQGSVPLLTEIAQNADESEWMRRRAVSLLGDSGDASALAAIQKAFESGDRSVRQEAALAMKKVGDDSLAQALIAEATRGLSNPDSALRAQALDSIGAMRDAATIPAIAGYLDDQNGNVRMAAVQALRQIGDASALPYLEKLAQDPVQSVRWSADRAIQDIKNPERRDGGGWSGFGGGGPGTGPGFGGPRGGRGPGR